jgi:hypothetical protein
VFVAGGAEAVGPVEQQCGAVAFGAGEALGDLLFGFTDPGRE